MITGEVSSWTSIVAIIGFVVVLFVLYKLLVDQKSATIESQKENIAYLKDQLADAKAQSPDILAQTLTNRVAMLEGELKRLQRDNSSTQEQIKEKEAELDQARLQAEQLSKKVLHARELLKDYLCPYCGAPLSQKAYQSESVAYQGREFDVEHEYTTFECGYEIVDGEVRGQCGTYNTKPVL